MDVMFFRGGGGGGVKKWHHDGRRSKKQNSISDYISCAKYLVGKEIVHENKLAGLGYSAGGLLVASAINCCPELFRAAVLKALQNSLLALEFAQLYLLNSFNLDRFTFSILTGKNLSDIVLFFSP